MSLACCQVIFFKLLLPPVLKMKKKFTPNLRVEIKYFGIYALLNLPVVINLQCNMRASPISLERHSKF